MSLCLLRAVSAVLLTSACTWGKFDDAEENAPVVSLKKPSDLRAGFGVSLSSVTSGSGVRLLVGGAPGGSPAAAYDLSRLGQPVVDAVSAGYCDELDTCFLAAQPAGIPILSFSEEPHELCFAVGVQQNQSGLRGVLVRCSDDTAFTLSVPPLVDEQLLAPAFGGMDGESIEVVFDTDDRDVPALVAASSSAGLSWLYPAGSAGPIQLVPAADDSSYGEAVAALNTAQGGVVAVAAPTRGHVWLFRDSGEPIGCLAGAAGFGRTLAGGRVNADADEDLVVADATNVSVFDGARLAALPVTGASDCSSAALPGAALIASFGCGTNSEVSGCPSGEFGASVAVGDLDGDGDGEVAVGAPGLNVRGQSRVGAVLIYDVEPEAPSELGDVRFSSSAETGDRLGSALALPRIGETSVIAAGAPGAGKTLVFYCSTLIPGDRRAERCK